MESMDLVRRIIEAGVDVFCVLTWRLYTRESLDEPMAIMEMLWRIYLSHQESLKKSKRSRENWSEKHLAADKGVMMSKICPAWLTVRDGKFVPAPERVKVIRTIFQWCIDGSGI